ncbi:tRNA uridine-5-carboxymethylaminomethyl(34) synthesis GTPase MnmE [Paenibacillus sp. PsM32]|uniref:tRNA modification GTPase MnmE n=1 Tax=Paenibacillus kyungheensis TaxID=1452732 RepID=A0AAX3M108_9BACL|nr:MULTISPECIES: tRNA uridine-5-carboxymethylaminomethyl(34) synthesis GTPase MnmE [Paenibacillus]MDN4618450.1 tRNA uridine-5-carboxymethylaminomethyl(34) synthesis GTPase MnmE [Paenibacillus sp. PsM32]MDQ1236533.1 tRNA modification GTPase [Paenibacillus sp. SORGH_AS_0306]MDR6108889.1 tRNA modification GTPase [Paenibacillus sp. SORGH_AS_0338]WCT55959.1 tRNA uridine-5-carboxymethylaminomethyl(34) synthesis GTPase MnmE [Paenibacillus kyungheensis]WDF50880.1 tRNA uridine-5-carboxymethylaminomethy
MISDTIAAISTAVGEAGIAVIRVSGPQSIGEVDQLFRGKQKLVDADSHTVHYGYIIDPDSGEKMEEVLVTIMRAPRSFTTEDVVEISSHGGVVSVRRLMELLLQQQIRIAEPGEFTKRAFLNGRIDLSQAEGVIDLIRSKSDKAFSVALRQVEGKLSRQIKPLQQILIEMVAHIEVNIDYPEHDVESVTSDFIKQKSLEVIGGIDELLRTANEGKILREGITTAIVGRPNVGKSSLLNTLAQDNRAIVTDIPGTTRDVIEEFVTINNIPLKLLDTAGIRETIDVVEKIGVERSRTAVSEADLILLVLNHNEALHEDEIQLLEQLKDRQVIIIVNKMDLYRQLDLVKLEEYFPKESIVTMSVKDQKGIDKLEEAISTLFFGGKLESADLTYVSNVRHIALLKQAKRSLQDAYQASDDMIPIDLIQIDVRLAWEQLGEIIGDSAPDSLIDQIFSQFCLGK